MNKRQFEKDREALIRGYLADIKEGNISIEDALDSIMCVAEQKTAELILTNVVKHYLCENSQGKARKVSGKKVDRVRSYMPARLCSHGQDVNSVSSQDGNSALGEAITRKSENSPSGIGRGSDIGDNSDAPASCSPQYQAKRDNCSGDGQRMGLPNHPVADTPSEKRSAEDLKTTESDEE